MPTDIQILEATQSSNWVAPCAFDGSVPVGAGWTANALMLAKAIKGAYLYNLPFTDQYYIGTFCNADPTFKDRVFLRRASDGATVGAFDAALPGKNSAGLTLMTLTGASGLIVANLYIDYSEMTATGILVNSLTGSPLYIARTSTDGELDARVSALCSAEPASGLGITTHRPLRVSVLGDSRPMGFGYLGHGSYLEQIEEVLFGNVATSIDSIDMMPVGAAFANNQTIQWRSGFCQKTSGAGNGFAFSMTGDELSICIGRERGNSGAANIDLYVNGAIYDTFSTYNDEPFATGIAKNFTGDGETILFDLGQCFTFNHVTKIAGVTKTGSLCAGGLYSTIPAGADYMVYRQMVVVGGVPACHHFLWFRTPPADGAAISCTFDAGESISWTQSTMGQTAKALSNNMEGSFGNPFPVTDLTAAPLLSSQVGFRQTDERSIKTWKFSSRQLRTFKLVISSLDPRATGTMPEFYMNFATSRMHRVQNAGIGGWNADEFLTQGTLNTVEYVSGWRPDIVVIDLGTNDDAPYRTNSAYVTRAGLTDGAVRGDETSRYFDDVSFDGAAYTVQDVRIPILSVTTNTAALDPTDATFAVEEGDVVVIGDYKGDNRRVAARVVTGWDAVTSTVRWDQPLLASDIAGLNTLSDLTGSYVRIFRNAAWRSNMQALVAHLRAQNPDVQIIIGCPGNPNEYVRTLEGYREYAAALARDVGVFFADIYGRARDWQYSQKQSAQLYLNASGGTVASGASSFALYRADGSQPDPQNTPNDYMLRRWSVKVNGVERYNDGTCFVSGGQTMGWPTGISPMSLSNAVAMGVPYKLNFAANTPPAGASVIVKYAPLKWAADDTHPGGTGDGPPLFAQAVCDALRPAIIANSGKPRVLC